MPRVTFEAEPAPLTVELDGAALVIIDMQRDSSSPAGSVFLYALSCYPALAPALTGPGEILAATAAE